MKSYEIHSIPRQIRVLMKKKPEQPIFQELSTDRNENQRAFYAATCPLIWGPYTAVELFELRSWMINRYRPIEALTESLPAEKLFIEAMLSAKSPTAAEPATTSTTLQGRPIV